MFSIDGYMTQKKLSSLLKNIYKEKYIKDEMYIPNTRFRWDGYFINNKSTKIVWEFDGPQHYQDINIIKRDQEKSLLATKHGYTLIRLPYWVQLSTEMFQFYFEDNISINQTYEHGFVDKNVVTPSSFSLYGLQRFFDEFKSLPINIQKEVLFSLHEKIKILGQDNVIPESLLNILSSDDFKTGKISLVFFK